MDLDATNLALLKTELTTDPEGIGYTDGSGGQVGNLTDADTLNSLTTGRQGNRDLVPTSSLLAAATREDLRALDAVDRELFRMLVSTGSVPVNDTNIREMLLDMFGGGTDTRANLAVLQKEPISRAVELFDQDVAAWDVARARELA